jgi:hypothetical protein
VLLVRRPLVVYTDSATPNWPEKDCDGAKPAYVPSAEEKTLLNALEADPVKIPTDLNRNELRAWGVLSEVLSAYKTTGDFQV